ncbi:FAD-dependent oxidoreductase [Salipiger mucosus]|uniref:trimethylamine monooxygenase n=1 Tax=Salipiger mucosus DSM 16094 TaxID=1123237 RepID=S9Q8Z9_9RHOB|nr:FAD-dependent oxidoreductase [Salipiger mucosus]EPX76477.1 putative secreted protein [Salipiger mucosus DSM 16094]
MNVHRVAVIGAGPVGLAAAAHLVEQGLEPIVFEKGARPGNAMRAWGHVRVFTPWRYVIDAAARRLLAAQGWSEPPSDGLPTGREIVDAYLTPLARHPGIADRLRLSSEIVAVSREDRSRIDDAERESALFVVRWTDASGELRNELFDAVVDASGTWSDPNPMGRDGLAVPGEAEASHAISYGIPDVLGKDRALFAGKSILVVGGGHSAANVALDLAALRAEESETEVYWGRRHATASNLVGGGEADELPARGQLGLAVQAQEQAEAFRVLAPFSAERLALEGAGVRVHARVGAKRQDFLVDRIVVTTGFRPNLAMLRELRLRLDPVVEAPVALAPLIDPNLHSCGSVPPHGVEELEHPEKGFYIVGMKSYGRAPTFLMLTGYEQVRSVACELAGDHAAARDVHLVLPETGVCGPPAALSSRGAQDHPAAVNSAVPCC